MIQLGNAYHDRATGWGGIATARTEYLDDGPSVRLQRLGADGDLEEQWFAEGRLVADEQPERGVGF